MLLHYIANEIETCGASTWKQIVGDIVAGQDMLKTYQGERDTEGERAERE